MEHMGWDDVMHPIVALNNASLISSAWISAQPTGEFQKDVDRGLNSTMWKNIIQPGFPTLECKNVTTNASNEADLIMFGSGNTPTSTTNAFSQQQLQHLSSSSGSTQLSDYVMSTNTPLINAYFMENHHFSANESINTNSINTKTLSSEGDGISSYDNISITIPSSRKRKPIEAPNDGMIHFNKVSKNRKMSDPVELTFVSSVNEGVLGCIPSSSAKGGSGGFSLNTPSLPKSSNINFKLGEISSNNSDAPDSETIAEMKKMIYRAAAFRPVNLGNDEVLEKPKRKNVKISSDPQTDAARQRRERISDRIRVLQRIVPGGNKMDTATMLDEAAKYLKFLRSQVKALDKSVPTVGFGFTSYNFLP